MHSVNMDCEPRPGDVTLNCLFVVSFVSDRGFKRSDDPLVQSNCDKCPTIRVGYMRSQFKFNYKQMLV